MELKSFVFIVLYQIVISGVFGEVSVGLTDSLTTVTPFKPNPTAILNGECILPSLPKDTDLSELILEYFHTQFPELSTKSPIVCTFSPPLLVTSITKPVSPSEIESNFEDTNCDNVPVLPDENGENNAFATNTAIKHDMPIIPFTIKFLTIPQYPLEEYLTDIYQNKVASSPDSYDIYASLIPNPTSKINSLQEDYKPSENVLERELERNFNRPIAASNNFIIAPTCNDNYPSYSSPITSISPCNINSYPIDPYSISTEPLYTAPYPLQYHLSSPESIASCNLENPYPNTCQELNPYSSKIFVPDNLYSDHVLPDCVTLRDISSITPQPNPCKTPDRSYSVKVETASTDIFSNDNVCNNPNNLPRYNKKQFENPIFPITARQYVEPPEIHQVYCDSDPSAHDYDNILNTIKNIDFERQSKGLEPVAFDTASYRIESPYENTVPYPPCDTTSVLKPTIDDTILDLARSLSSHFMSYLEAKSGKEESGPMAAVQFKSDVNPSPTPSCIEINPTIPKKITPETNYNLKSNIPNHLSTTTSSLHDPIPGDDKFNLLKVISSAVSKSTDLPLKIDISSAMSENVSVYPSVSNNYPTSQQHSLSPSAVASTSNVVISLPGELKIQVKKLKSLKHKPKTFKKLLELIFLAELLNDDEDIDWEAIDTVLELLSTF